MYCRTRTANFMRERWNGRQRWWPLAARRAHVIDVSVTTCCVSIVSPNRARRSRSSPRQLCHRNLRACSTHILCLLLSGSVLQQHRRARPKLPLNVHPTSRRPLLNPHVCHNFLARLVLRLKVTGKMDQNWIKGRWMGLLRKPHVISAPA